MPTWSVGVGDMNGLPISRDERLAKLAAALGVDNDICGAVPGDRSGISDEDLALLVDAIDSGDFWRLLEQRPELLPAPAAPTKQLKWSVLLKAAMQSDADGNAP